MFRQHKQQKHSGFGPKKRRFKRGSGLATPIKPPFWLEKTLFLQGSKGFRNSGSRFCLLQICSPENGVIYWPNYNTLPETNSSHLKMDGWNTNVLLGWPIFRGYVSFRVREIYQPGFPFPP